MSHIICTHCMTAVPHGATVCRGCKAEIEYGVPDSTYGVLVLGSALLGLGVIIALAPMLERFSMFLEFVLWCIVFIALFARGLRIVEKRYKDRVVFTRIYRTR
jgi:hypothetical protein